MENVSTTKKLVLKHYAFDSKFQQMFPTDLSEITLDWGDNDSIQEFTVTFAYDFWTAATGSGSPSSSNAIA